MDEMSMIGKRILHHIEGRCFFIFSNNKEQFSGIFVYMFGDFRQLPLVNNRALYSNVFSNNNALKGSLIYESFEHVIELSVAYIQNTDINF